MTTSTTSNFLPRAIRKIYPTAQRVEVAEIYTAASGWVAAKSSEWSERRATILALKADSVSLRITIDEDGGTVVADFRSSEIAPTKARMRAVLAEINPLALASLYQQTGSELAKQAFCGTRR